VESDEADLNYLMSILLDKVTFLPFGYLMDLYRWDIFDGTVGKDKYQEHWDKLRLQYQGLIPPNDRSKVNDAFDAAGKYHIPANTPYIRYFVSFIVQFQFYEKMCTLAGEYDPKDPTKPLYKCDFYNNDAAGKALKNVLQQGQSQPWQTTLNDFLCGDSVDPTKCDGGMNAGSLIRYFKPIEEWLDTNRAENNWEIGWNVDSNWKPCGYDADECPMSEDTVCSTDLDYVEDGPDVPDETTNEPTPTQPATTQPASTADGELPDTTTAGVPDVTSPDAPETTEATDEPTAKPTDETTTGAASVLTLSLLSILCILFI